MPTVLHIDEKGEALFENPCRCGEPFVKLEDPSERVRHRLAGKDHSRPGSLEPLRVTCRHGHVHQVASVDVTRTGAKVSLF
jgi:hypothetical protein